MRQYVAGGPGPRRRVDDASLRQLFDANVIGIVIANNAGAILEANDAFLTMLGYARAELEGGRLDWRHLTPAEFLPLDERAIDEMARHGSFAAYEKEYVRRDGTRVPVSVGGARLAGTLDEQICFIVDLSEMRRTQAALRRSESRFEGLRDADVLGIVTWRLSDREFVTANDEFLRTIGYERADLLEGRLRWGRITPPEWLAAGERAIAALRSDGRFTPFEKEYLRKDGTRVPVLIGGALLDGSEDETVCYVLDLSAQKEAVRRIQESEQRYRILAEALPQIIMLAYGDRRPVYVNRRYEEYTGIKSAEVTRRWHEVIHPDDLPAIHAARATGQPYEVEYRLRRAADGAYRWHYARCLKIPDEFGQTHWLAAAMDIDDRKRAEESLRFIEKAGTRLSQSLDIETTFETMLDLLVPEFGDWAALNLRQEDGRIQTIAARHRDPAKAAFAETLRGVDYFRETHDWGTAAAYRSGRPQLVSHVTREAIEAAVKPQFFECIDALGFGSFIALPILAGEEVIGSFLVVSAGGRRSYSAADLPGLEELARRAGFAIANARRYEREHRVADMLQEAALPRKLPLVAGFTLDGYYRAGRQEALIGGDWFDAIVVSDGRIVISVGDVAGSGLHAAVLMGNVRQVIRGAAHVYADPMMMFEIADRTLRSEDEERMVTAFVGVIDPTRRTMLYASAGHVPALMRTSGGEILELSAPGLPLGYRGMAASESRTAMLPRGSSLLLYTDGLVEWSRDIVAGEALLRRRFAEAEPGVPHPAKALVDSVLATGAVDDVAALMVTIDS